jgi:hypothetical protein
MEAGITRSTGRGWNADFLGINGPRMNADRKMEKDKNRRREKGRKPITAETRGRGETRMTIGTRRRSHAGLRPAPVVR